MPSSPLIEAEFQTYTGDLTGKKVVIVLADLVMGGVERQAIVLADGLKRQHGARVEILGFRSGELVGLLDRHYRIPWTIVRAVAWPTGRRQLTRSLVTLARLLRSRRPDVILAHLPSINVLCGLVWRLTGARCCVWYQENAGLDRFNESMERLAASLTPCFVSNSQHATRFLTEKLGVRPERIRVIRYGVDILPASMDADAWRKSLGVDKETFVVSMVANLRRAKDHATLLRAWRIVLDRLQRRQQKAVLLLAGRFGDTELACKALAFDLNLGQQVYFLGTVEDVSGLLTASDLAVLSSRSEGCPNAVLEPMAVGLPVVGTDIPGVREAVGPDYPHLAPAGDPELLAEKILEFARSPDLRRRVGSMNRCRVESEFTRGQMWHETAQLIRYCVHRNHPNRRGGLMFGSRALWFGKSSGRPT